MRENEERDRLRAEKAREVVERKTQKEHDKQVCDAEKALELFQKVTLKTLKSTARSARRQRGGAAAHSGACLVTPSQEAPTKTTRRSRTSRLPERYT